MATLSERLKEALRMRRMTQKELAVKAGISIGNITHYVYGRNQPKREYLLNIAKVLDVNFMWLMGYDAPVEVEEELIDTEKIISGMTRLYGQGAGRMIYNYCKLNEYGQLKVADYIQNLLSEDKYRSDI